MKYARPVAVDGKHRMYDVIDTDDFNPKPAWWTSDAAAFDRMFAPNAEAWKAAGQWFVEVPPRVQDGAVHAGNDYMDKASYTNPDGTTAEDPPPPEQED